MRSLFWWGENRMRPSVVLLGILAATGASFSYAATAFIANHAVTVYAPAMVVVACEAIFGIGYIVALNVRQLANVRVKHVRSGGVWALLAGIGIFCGVSGFYTALEHAPLSVAVPIIGSVPLTTYLFVLLLLRGAERVTRRALMGATLVVIGVGLIGIYNV